MHFYHGNSSPLSQRGKRPEVDSRVALSMIVTMPAVLASTVVSAWSKPICLAPPLPMSVCAHLDQVCDVSPGSMQEIRRAA